MRTSFYICFILIGFWAASLEAQDRIYDQFIRGNKVGHLHVTTNYCEAEKVKTILVESVVNVNVFFAKSRIEYTGRAVYENGVLKEAEIEILRDGSIHKKSHTKKSGDSYSLVIDGDSRTKDRGEISFSSLMLYTKEPMGVGSVYAEADGIFNRLRDLGKGVYELHLNGSRNNFYHYENGELVKAKLDHWIAPIVVKLRE